MPLDTDHTDEVCEDIKNQYESGISNFPLFMMTLVPEGNPPADNVESKLQLLGILKNAGELPFCCPSDAEKYVRAADMPDGSRTKVDFTKNGEALVLDCPCYTLDPVIMFIY